jgi:hypothetical protein
VTTGYHRAFIDPVRAGYLLTMMVSDGVTLVIEMWLYSKAMKPVEQILSIRHTYGGSVNVEMA